MDNRSFWNERYSKCLELGSGPGSRGYAAWVKQDLIRKAVQFNNIHTIADFGCGDLYWLKEALLDGIEYTGVDISDVIIARNRERYPSLKFIEHDVAATRIDLLADLVISFDVLLHQCSAESFEKALRHILWCVEKHGLISSVTPDRKHATTGPAPQHVLQDEQEFQGMLKRLDNNLPRARVAFYGDLCDWIPRVTSGVEIRPLVAYRAQTIYEVTRVGRWLQRVI